MLYFHSVPPVVFIYISQTHVALHYYSVPCFHQIHAVSRLRIVHEMSRQSEQDIWGKNVFLDRFAHYKSSHLMPKRVVWYLQCVFLIASHRHIPNGISRSHENSICENRLIRYLAQHLNIRIISLKPHKHVAQMSLHIIVNTTSQI